jgi:serine/threonine protein kinase/Flp pilus assembly protein TadD
MTTERRLSRIDPPAGSVAARMRPALRLESVLRDVSAGSGFGWRTGKTSVLDQAYEAYCQCLEAGVPPDPEEFCRRYPRYKSSLRRLIDVHHCIEENAPTDAGILPARWPEQGDSFLGFSLQEELGRGAFARVFLANEPALGNRLVVVKVSLKGAAEAETLGRLEHPNIVPVYSVQKEELSGLSAVCMPYLGSATLCDVLDRAFAQPGIPAKARIILEAAQEAAPSDRSATDRPSPSPWLQSGTYIDGVVHLGAELAEALRFVHSHGICHRDLKPSNILLTPDGTPMLLDFNLAFDKQRTEQRLGGTLPYMAPEHLRATDPNHDGPSPVVDERSDLFSLGVILYELLTGVHPFGPIPWNRSARYLRAVLLERQERGAKPLRQVNSRVDPALARIIEQCLAYDPSDRPASAGDMMAVLRRRLVRVKWARRLRPVLGTAALAVLLSVSGVAGVHVLTPDRLQGGLNAYRDGQYDRAVSLLNRVLETDPGNREALYARGRAKQKRDDIDGAYEDFRRLEDLAPDGKIKSLLAYCMNRRVQHREAIVHYQAAIEDGFGSAEVFNNLGYSYLQLHRIPEAKTRLSDAIRLDASLQPAFFNRALLDLEMWGNDPEYMPEAGLRDVEVALRLGPETAELHLLAARLNAVAAKRDIHFIDPALDHLRSGLGGDDDRQILEQDVYFKSLRSHSRFQDLFKQPTSSNLPRKATRLVDPVQDPPG